MNNAAEIIESQRESAMSAVARIEPIPVPATESAGLTSMIERMARDPSVSLDRMERLLEMKERIDKTEAEGAFNAAMSGCQSEMRAVAADSNNPQTRSKYASYFALDRAMRPIYTKHGFALRFGTGEGAPEGCVRVTCKVSHGRYSESTHIDMPADGKGAKGGDVMTKTHATGAAYTYGQRYLLKMIFNIAVGESDDDGNSSAGPAPKITDEQLDEITKLGKEVRANEAQFLAYFKISSLSDIPASRFDEAMAILRRRKS